jgi:hypothetical protein
LGLERLPMLHKFGGSLMGISCCSSPAFTGSSNALLLLYPRQHKPGGLVLPASHNTAISPKCCQTAHAPAQDMYARFRAGVAALHALEDALLLLTTTRSWRSHTQHLVARQASSMQRFWLEVVATCCATQLPREVAAGLQVGRVLPGSMREI